MSSSPNGGLLAAGIGVLAITWLGSVGAVPTLASNEDEQGIDGDGIEGSDWLPLLVPFAGPFWAIHTVNASPELSALLVIDGILQFTGVAMIIGGALDRTHRAVRLPDEAASATIRIAPLITQHYQGIGIHGAL